ncbi:MAG: MFS transporter [Mycoplasma sp.]|nr:MFS transporter [Mycoplasma sp.]
MLKDNWLVFIIVFIMIIAIIINILYKAKDIKFNNLLIFTSLVIFWLPIQMILGDGIGNIPRSKWTTPILFALFQLTQSVFRLPFGILSNKLNSRKIPIQLGTTIFMFTAIISIASVFSNWSLFLVVFGAGVFGSLFGLENQYWAENWNKKRAFYSTIIMFCIPMISSSLGTLVNLYSPVHSDYVIAKNPVFKWSFISVICINFIVFIFYSLSKEQKETIVLDKKTNDPNFIDKTKVKKSTIKLCFMIILVSFASSLINNLVIKELFDKNNKYWELIKPIIPLLTVSCVAVSILYLIPLMGIGFVKFFSLFTIFLGSFIFLIVVATGSNLYTLETISILMIIIGASIFQTTLSGMALHLDLKFPALILGIFLSLKSFSIGSSTLISGEMVSYLSHKDLTLAISISCFVIITLLSGFVILTHKRMKDLNNSIIKYEF